MCEIVEAIGISLGAVVSIFSGHFYVREILARRPRLLAIAQELNRAAILKECLVYFNRNSDEFMLH